MVCSEKRCPSLNLENQSKYASCQGSCSKTLPGDPEKIYQLPGELLQIYTWRTRANIPAAAKLYLENQSKYTSCQGSCSKTIPGEPEKIYQLPGELLQSYTWRTRANIPAAAKLYLENQSKYTSCQGSYTWRTIANMPAAAELYLENQSKNTSCQGSCSRGSCVANSTPTS